MMVTARTRTTISLAALVLVFIVVAGAGLLVVNRYENNYQAGQRRLQEQQRRAGLAFQAKLCADFGAMARLKPPPGKPSANPSRAYEQAEHRTWLSLYQAIGCKETP